MATQKEVAEKAGVSFITVSRFLNDSGYVKKETREKIQKAIKDLNYHPDVIGQALQKGTMKSLGLIVPPFSCLPWYGTDFYHLFLQGVHEAGGRHGYDILYSTYDNESPSACLQLYHQRKAAGIILFIPDTDMIDLDEIVKHEIPCVIYGERPVNHPVSFVDADDNDAFFRMTEYLIEQNIRSFAFLKGPEKMFFSRDRYDGFIRAVTKHGIPSDDVRMYQGNMCAAFGIASMERMLSEKNVPEAVLCTNDLVALGAMKAAKRAGLRIPDDLSICGYDDISMIEISDPLLTSIRPPVFRMGGASVELLLELIENPGSAPKEMIFPAELMIRDSTKKI